MNGGLRNWRPTSAETPILISGSWRRDGESCAFGSTNLLPMRPTASKRRSMQLEACIGAELPRSRLVSKSCGLPRPSLDFAPVPDQCRLELSDRGRKVCVPSSPIVDDLRAGYAEPSGDLMRAHEILHVHLVRHRVSVDEEISHLGLQTDVRSCTLQWCVRTSAQNGARCHSRLVRMRAARVSTRWLRCRLRLGGSGGRCGEGCSRNAAGTRGSGVGRLDRSPVRRRRSARRTSAMLIVGIRR